MRSDGRDDRERRTPERVHRPLAALALVALLSQAGGAHAAVAPPTYPQSDLALLEVAPFSFAERAGLRPGDRLDSWRREAAPPFNPLPASGTLRSPFDLLEAMIEEAPRGALTLTGHREGLPQTWTLPAGASWERFGVSVEGLESVGLDQASWRIVQRASALDRQRRFDEGDPAFAQAVDLLILEGRRTSAAWVLESWGRSLARRSLWERALAIQTRAIELLGTGKKGALALSRALFERGETYRLRADYPHASVDLRVALRLRQSYAPGSSEEGLSLFALGRSLVEGEGEPRGDLLVVEAELVQRRIDRVSLDRVRTLDYWSVRAWERGEREAGDRGFAEALRMARRLAPVSYEMARVLNHMGRYAGRRSDIEGAERLLREALDLWRALPPDYIHLYNLASCLTDQAFLSVAEGDFDGATAYAGEALETQRRINPRSLGVVWALLTHGYVARERGDVQLARTLFAEAVEMQRSISTDAFSLGLSLSSLGRLEVLAGEDLAKAEALLREAQGLFEESGEREATSQGYADLLRGFASLAAKRGDLVSAIAWAERAEAIRARLSPQTTGEAETLAELGRFERDAGRNEAAVRHLCGAVGIIDRISGLWAGVERARSQFTAGYANDARDCISVLLAAGRSAEAFRILEGAKARGLVDQLGARRPGLDELPAPLREEVEALRREWDAAQASLADLAAKPDGPELQRALGQLVDLQRRKDEQVVRARVAAPRVADFYFPEPVSAAAARNLVARGSLLLEYSISSRDAWLFVIRPREEGGPDVRTFRLDAKEATLRRDVERLRAHLSDPRSEPRALGLDAARLYATLLSPIERELRDAERLVIVPDGPLYGLPFSVLQPRPGSYLVQSHEVAIGMSATVLVELGAQGGPATHPTQGEEVAVFGDPAGEVAREAVAASRRGVAATPTRGGRLSPLPSARREAEVVAGLYPGSRLYLGPAATEGEAKRLNERVRIVHFAAHAVLDERVPVNSALVLSPGPSDRPGGEDGMLRSWEIMEQMRLRADLVTLSACGSGLGRELPGEGLVGLARAFLFAGTRSVLASLWSIDDRATASIMERFYRSLAAGVPKATALRLAQLEALRTPARAHPFFWAAFELLGEAGPPRVRHRPR